MACGWDSTQLVRRRLRTAIRWLEDNGENGAAASKPEGLGKTLTVPKLELPVALRGLPATTQAIENLNCSARRISGNLAHWRSGDMILRWTAIALLLAEQDFRRIRGYRDLPCPNELYVPNLPELT